MKPCNICRKITIRRNKFPVRKSTGNILRKTENVEPLKEKAYLGIQEKVPVWVKSGSNTVLGSDLPRTAGEFIWVKVEAYSIKITVFGTFTLQKRLFLLVGVSGFELYYFGLFDVFGTFICANLPFCSKYSIISNYIFCVHPLKGFSKGKNKGKFLMGTCFL